MRIVHSPEIPKVQLVPDGVVLVVAHEADGFAILRHGPHQGAGPELLRPLVNEIAHEVGLRPSGWRQALPASL